MRTLLLLALPLAGCAASRAVAPLGKGEHGLTLDLGGPFVEFAGAPVPIPFFVVGWRYGVDGHSDVHAALHVTGLATLGVGGVDVGFARELLTARGARPRLMVDLTGSLFFGGQAPGGAPGGFRFFPEASLVATWDLPHAEDRRPHRIYVGTDHLFQANPTFHYVFTPLAGVKLRAHPRLDVQLEVQWNAPWVDNRFANPVWIGLGGKGAIGARLGFDVYFPARTRRGEG